MRFTRRRPTPPPAAPLANLDALAVRMIADAAAMLAAATPTR